MASDAFRPRAVGRYVLHDVLGTGGFATVYLGCLSGPGGFERLVAIKRHHPTLAKDDELRRMLLDEARLSASIRHPSVVSTLDVFSDGDEVYLAMDYVNGLSLAKLLSESTDHVPIPLAIRIAVDILEGLHAAHTATDTNGEPLGIVHRDVSPQNVLIGVDGVARVTDFGIAKARDRLQTTEHGNVKGKAAYMAPEQLRGEAAEPRADVFGAAVIVWELLCHERLFAGTDEIANLLMVLEKPIPDPRTRRPDVPPAIADVVLRGLARDPRRRYATAHEMALALEHTCIPAPHRDVGAWVKELGGGVLAQRSNRADEVETTTRAFPAKANVGTPPPAPVPTLGDRPRSRTFERVVFSAAVLIAVATLVRLERGEPAPGPPAAATSAPPPSASSAIPPSTGAPEPSLGLGLDPTPSESTPAPPPSRAPVTTSPRRPARVPAQPRQPPAPNCKPPYTIDDRGFHIPKPECLPGASVLSP